MPAAINKRMGRRWLWWAAGTTLGVSIPWAVWMRDEPAPVVAAAPARVETVAPEIQGVRMKFFGNEDGRELGRLRIARIALERRRDGFLRVAFRPLVVLDEVTLEIGAEAVWPETGEKIVAALKRFGGDEAELRTVRVEIGGAAPQRIRARSARLRGDGALELREVVDETAMGLAAAGAQPGRRIFWLSGARAGQWGDDGAGPVAPPAPTAAATTVATHTSPLPFE